MARVRDYHLPPASSGLDRPRRVHDDGHSDEAEECAGDVPAVGSEAVGDHAPGEGAGDEDATVGGEDTAEVGIGLQGGNEAVEAEGDDPSADLRPALVLADALPDKPSASDLGEGGQDEQQDRLQHHEVRLASGFHGWGVLGTVKVLLAWENRAV